MKVACTIIVLVFIFSFSNCERVKNEVIPKLKKSIKGRLLLVDEYNSKFGEVYLNYQINDSNKASIFLNDIQIIKVDSNYSFEFKNIDEGNYKIIATCPGYGDGMVEVNHLTGGNSDTYLQKLYLLKIPSVEIHNIYRLDSLNENSIVLTVTGFFPDVNYQGWMIFIANDNPDYSKINKIFVQDLDSLISKQYFGYIFPIHSNENNNTFNSIQIKVPLRHFKYYKNNSIYLKAYSFTYFYDYKFNQMDLKYYLNNGLRPPLGRVSSNVLKVNIY